MNINVTGPKRFAIAQVIGRLAGMAGTLTWMNRVVLADLTAGDGCGDTDSTARTIVKNGIYLREKGKNTAIILNDNDLERAAHLDQAFGSSASISTGDMVDRLSVLSCGGYDGGVVLMDPYGTFYKGEVGRMGDAVKHGLGRVDILLSVGATGCKRANGVNPDKARTGDIRDGIPKSNWYVLQPFSQFQWTLMLGTSAASIKPIENIGFVRADSEAGKEICKTIDMTKEEINDGQQPELPNL